jgi:hypothetical protein
MAAAKPCRCGVPVVTSDAVGIAGDIRGGKGGARCGSNPEGLEG